MSSRATIDDSFSPSVLLIRLDAIGDALALAPLLHAFHSASIPVDLVLRTVNREALSPLASRARYVAPFAPRSTSRSTARAITSFARDLRSQGYT
ncbi:MAG: hypothetical protein M3N13_10385, partial [Candidatus Eremiobacteraeota bacterium]|nr:hypothetical protein [Candidatus Eremiobacteraeota bacterium]